MNEEESYKIAEQVVKWISDQKYQGQDILHAAVCCDYVGMVRFTKCISNIIRGKEPHSPS